MVSPKVSAVDAYLPQPEPRSRAGFIKCFFETTLDPNTANTHLSLSVENRKVTCVFVGQSGQMCRQRSDPEQREPDRTLLLGGGERFWKSFCGCCLQR